jgi:hypothetical protein
VRARNRLAENNEHTRKKETRKLEAGTVWALTSNTAGPGDAYETYFFKNQSLLLSFLCFF